jgi:hypothetical protein
MRALFKRRPSAAMIVAATALFVALGAGAYAASHLPKNSVGSNAIKAQGVKTRNYQKGSILGRFLGDKQVKTAAIHDGAVTSGKANFISSNSVSSSVSTTSTTPVDLGGPTVTVTVPEGGIVELFAQADISVNGGGAPTAKVDLVEPTLVSNPTGILASKSGTFQTVRTSPGSSDFNGVINATRAGWITLVPAAGTYTFGLRYETSGGTATFQNRTLLASVIH